MTIENKLGGKTEKQLKRMREIKEAQWADPDWRKWNIEQVRKGRAKDDVKEKVRRAHLGKKHTEETKKILSEIKGDRKKKLLPHLLRNIPPVEIILAEPEFGIRKVYDAYNAHRKTGELKRPTPEETSQKLREAQLGRKGHERKEISSTQRRRAEFVHSLREEGFIGEDITNWITMHNMYEREGREFPKDLGIIGRESLEIFMVGMKSVYDGDSTIRNRYISLGQKVDEEWFDNDDILHGEHVFIRDAVAKERKMNGSGSAGVLFQRDILNSLVIHSETKPD